MNRRILPCLMPLATSLLLVLMVSAIRPVCAQQQAVAILRGTVVSSLDGSLLAGATIRLKGTEAVTRTDSMGRFRLTVPAFPQNGGVLYVTYVGFKSLEVPVKDASALRIVLQPDAEELKEVVVSTGYQQLPAERATGSFVVVDNKLLNRRVSTGVLDRLEDVTSGLLFNKGKSAAANLISIRGQNTIYGNAGPLIVIDNFPYEGDINSINPNDVESISVLKDAAAASIWGSRAGNGVIVIVTKKGRFNQGLRVGVNASTTVGGTPDAFYQPRMSSADFIGVEKTLFAQGFYQYSENGYNNPALTPAVELLIAERDGHITSADADAQLAALSQLDVRHDFQRYFYQRSISQQYAVNLSGGSELQRFYLSAGYDHNRDNLVRNGYGRYTFNASQTISLINKKLDISTAVYYSQAQTALNNSGTTLIGLNAGDGSSLYPYAQLADAAGNPLAITHDHRVSFIQAAQSAGLLDWTYKPLEELRNADHTSGTADYRLNLNLSYKILPYLSASVLYQYGRTVTDVRNLQASNSYYTRDLVNNYTQADPLTGQLRYGIPAGGILDLQHLTALTQDIRGQLSLNKEWDGKHTISAIAGYELRDFHTTGNSNRSYGYDEEHATALPVDYVTQFTQYSAPIFAEAVPYYDGLTDLTDRNISYYANAAYSYLYRYTFSASARLDRSNLFGVRANQQGVPLYSAGISWNADKEPFYHLAWLPMLKLRLTYGYNGNVNKSLSAYTTAQFLTGNLINTPYAQIINPPNPDLRWERVKIINAGLDFALAGNRISGSIEPYWKRGIDLIGDIPYAPSTGISTFRGNTAGTKGKGIDVTLNSRDIEGDFSWQTSLLFSHVTDKVVDYSLTQDVSYYTGFADNEVYPMNGRPFYAVYSYRFAGLDGKTGDPQGYLNGAVSTDYYGITSGTKAADLVYSGSARPTTYGALRNTFGYKQLSLSFNISYRFGYYFRQRGIFYNSVLSGVGYYEGQYADRWQVPGDELRTSVPSMPATFNYSRDSFYNFSTATVEKGDNIRLQDLSLSWTFGKGIPKAFRSLQVYAYANNLGILWKATKTSFDPDYATAEYPPVRTIALGIKAEL